MIIRCLIVWLVLSVQGAVAVEPGVERVFRIAVPDRTDSFTSVSTMQLRLAQAYRQLGIRVEWIAMPLQRSEAMLALGEIDAELVRRAIPPELAGRIVQVDEPLMELSTAVFGLDPNIRIRGADDLACCRVGIIRNFRTSERLATVALAIERGATLAELQAMLKAGRVDLILGVYSTGKAPLSALGEDADPVVRVINPELNRSHGYHVLAIKHAALAVALAKALQQTSQTRPTHMKQ